MSVNSPSDSLFESATRIPVDMRRVPGIRRLATDYIFDFKAVAPFFVGDPANRDAWTEALARAQAYRRRRDEIASVIAAQQQRRGAPIPAVESAKRLTDSRSVAVVTGQQAGLFGGPLFTLLKALTALKLADQVSREHHVPAVAIFWIEAEDHDWDEVRACTVFDDQLEPRTVSLPPRPGTEPVPVAQVILGAPIHEAIADLGRILPPTEFSASLLDQLRDAYSPGLGMADAFGRWLERVLGDRGLVVYDASDAAAKPLVAEVFGRELSSPGQTASLAASAGSALVARGYHAQVHSPDDGLALFHLGTGRQAIRHQDGQFVVGDAIYPASALRQEVHDRPATFSPGVLLRPIVQDMLFPTICYVAGPNELAYLGQLRSVYEHFGVPMPLMRPRATATVLDAQSIRFLTKYQLPLEALQPQDEAALNELLKRQIPASVEESFTTAAQTIEAQMTAVIKAVPAIDPTLEGAARSTLGRLQKELDGLHGKLIQAAKRRNETLRRQFVHARALAFPHGHAQERTIGFVSFLNQYGPAFVDRLGENLPLDMGYHWVLAI